MLTLDLTIICAFIPSHFFLLLLSFSLAPSLMVSIPSSSFSFPFLLLGIHPRTSSLLSKPSTTVWHFQLHLPSHFPTVIQNYIQFYTNFFIFFTLLKVSFPQTICPWVLVDWWSLNLKLVISISEVVNLSLQDQGLSVLWVSRVGVSRFFTPVFS